MAQRSLNETPGVVGFRPDDAWNVVDSTAINAWRYFPDLLTLQIQWKNGGTYEYYGVPDTIVDFLDGASSYGRTVYYAVRDNYPYKRIA